jgi:hypothetical protein
VVSLFSLLFFRTAKQRVGRVIRRINASCAIRTLSKPVIRVAIGWGLLAACGCTRPYISAPGVRPTVMICATPQKHFCAGADAPAQDQKPTLLQRADRCAGRVRDDAVVVQRTVIDKCETVTNSDVFITTATVIAVPFFLFAPRTCSSPIPPFQS